MKSAIGERLRRVLDKSGRSQKEVALAAHERASGTGKADTFEQKLSKLLNGDPEGARFFFDDPARSEALRLTLGVETTEWLGLPGRPALIAFELTESARDFLGRSDVIVSFVDQARVTAEVKEWSGPRHIVTCKPVSAIDRALVGALEALEVALIRLVPDGDPAFARRWRLDDGPLFGVTHEPLPAEVNGWPPFPSKSEPRGEAQQRDYERYGCVLQMPQDRFPDVLIVESPPPEAARGLWGTVQSVEGHRRYIPREGYLWSHRGQLFSIGVKPEALAGLKGVTPLDGLARLWADGLRREAINIHPNHRRGWLRERFSAWRAEVAQGNGFNRFFNYGGPDADLHVLQDLSIEPKAPWALPAPAPRAHTATVEPVRSAIRDLLGRDGVVPPKWLFTLRAMLSARAIATAHPADGPFIGAATFDLGAGVLVTAAAWRFNTDAGPVTLNVDASSRLPHIDGGDLVLQVSHQHEVMLEGSAPWLTGRRRRDAAALAEAEEAAQRTREQEEDDAWDD